MAPARPTVLNVDDRDPSRYARSRVLRHAGFDVTEAVTARDALALASKRPDVILLDINLPDLSGLEVCRRLKADPATSDIAVVHISATFTQSDDRAAGLDSGADAYLVEPVEASELLAVIRALMRTREAEDAARRAAKEAQEALAARDQFLASAAHELATPLTAVYGWVQRTEHFIERGDLDQARDHAARARASVAVLVEEMRALLDLSGADGAITLQPRTIDVRGTIRGVVAEVGALANTEIALRVPDDEVVGEADPMRLRQVVRNLLSNAIRHGRPPVEVELAADDGIIRVAVRDHGDGIPEGERDRIFQPYVRLDHGRRGLGLGLPIVRAIVSAMDGEIVLESAPGAGTIFVVTLPKAGG